MYIRRKTIIFKAICLKLALIFCLSLFAQEILALRQLDAYAFNALLPAASAPSSLPVLKGIHFDPANPLKLEFIIEGLNEGRGAREEGRKSQQQTPGNEAFLKQETEKLIRYFLAGLTIPEEDLWVNLSPYEQDRIIPNALAATDIGKGLLEEDYILKQLASSVTHPDSPVGKNYWSTVYAQAQKILGTTKIPLNTFNKIWITPDKAQVYQSGNTILVSEARLKVMMEEDYLAAQKSTNGYRREAIGDRENERPATNDWRQKTNNLTTQTMREVVLPVIEADVNHGDSFAQLRQIYNSLILALWFKNKLLQAASFTSQDKNNKINNLETGVLNPEAKNIFNLYIDKNKIKGIDTADPKTKENVYNRYLEAFKKGLYDLTRKEIDQGSKRLVRRRYFSGGTIFSGFNKWASSSAKPPKLGFDPLKKVVIQLREATGAQGNEAGGVKSAGGVASSALILPPKPVITLHGGKQEEAISSPFSKKSDALVIAPPVSSSAKSQAYSKEDILRMYDAALDSSDVGSIVIGDLGDVLPGDSNSFRDIEGMEGYRVVDIPYLLNKNGRLFFAEASEMPQEGSRAILSMLVSNDGSKAIPCGIAAVNDKTRQISYVDLTELFDTAFPGGQNRLLFYNNREHISERYKMTVDGMMLRCYDKDGTTLLYMTRPIVWKNNGAIFGLDKYEDDAPVIMPPHDDFHRDFQNMLDYQGKQGVFTGRVVGVGGTGQAADILTILKYGPKKIITNDISPLAVRVSRWNRDIARLRGVIPKDTVVRIISGRDFDWMNDVEVFVYNMPGISDKNPGRLEDEILSIGGLLLKQSRLIYTMPGKAASSFLSKMRQFLEAKPRRAFIRVNAVKENVNRHMEYLRSARLNAVPAIKNSFDLFEVFPDQGEHKEQRKRPATAASPAFYKPGNMASWFPLVVENGVMESWQALANGDFAEARKALLRRNIVRYIRVISPGEYKTINPGMYGWRKSCAKAAGRLAANLQKALRKRGINILSREEKNMLFHVCDNYFQHSLPEGGAGVLSVLQSPHEQGKIYVCFYNSGPGMSLEAVYRQRHHGQYSYYNYGLPSFFTNADISKANWIQASLRRFSDTNNKVFKDIATPDKGVLTIIHPASSSAKKRENGFGREKDNADKELKAGFRRYAVKQGSSSAVYSKADAEKITYSREEVVNIEQTLGLMQKSAAMMEESINQVWLQVKYGELKSWYDSVRRRYPGIVGIPAQEYDGVIGILNGIARALKFVKGKDILHHDEEPGNMVLFNNDGSLGKTSPEEVFYGLENMLDILIENVDNFIILSGEYKQIPPSNNAFGFYMLLVGHFYAYLGILRDIQNPQNMVIPDGANLNLPGGRFPEAVYRHFLIPYAELYSPWQRRCGVAQNAEDYFLGILKQYDKKGAALSGQGVDILKQPVRLAEIIMRAVNRNDMIGDDYFENGYKAHVFYDAKRETFSCHWYEGGEPIGMLPNESGGYKYPLKPVNKWPGDDKLFAAIKELAVPALYPKDYRRTSSSSVLDITKEIEDLRGFREKLTNYVNNLEDAGTLQEAIAVTRALNDKLALWLNSQGVLKNFSYTFGEGYSTKFNINYICTRITGHLELYQLRADYNNLKEATKAIRLLIGDNGWLSRVDFYLSQAIEGKIPLKTISIPGTGRESEQPTAEVIDVSKLERRRKYRQKIAWKSSQGVSSSARNVSIGIPDNNSKGRVKRLQEFYSNFNGGNYATISGKGAYISILSISKNFREEIAHLIGKKRKGQSVLSVGAGNGYLEKELRGKYGVKVVSVDIVAKPLKKILKTTGPAVVSDAEKLSFKKNAFDVVIFPESIGNMNVKKALAGAFRVLKPGGSVFILTYFDQGVGYSKKMYRADSYEGLRKNILAANFENPRKIPTSLEDEGYLVVKALKPFAASHFREDALPVRRVSSSVTIKDGTKITDDMRSAFKTFAFLTSSINGESSDETLLRLKHKLRKKGIKTEAIQRFIDARFDKESVPIERLNLSGCFINHYFQGKDAVDARPVNSKLLGAPYVAYYTAVKNTFNSEDKPLVGMYLTAGADVLNFFQATNSSEGFFFDAIYNEDFPPGDIDDYGLEVILSKHQAVEYRNHKFQAAFADSTLSWLKWWEAVIVELDALGVERNELIKILQSIHEQSGKKDITITFDWAYNFQEKRKRIVHFIAGNVMEKNTYDICRGKNIDFIYQCASTDLITNGFKDIVSYVSPFLRPNAFLILDTYDKDFHGVSTSGGMSIMDFRFPLYDRGHADVAQILKDTTIVKPVVSDNLLFWKEFIKQAGFNAKYGLSGEIYQIVSSPQAGKLGEPNNKAHIYDKTSLSGKVISSALPSIAEVMERFRSFEQRFNNAVSGNNPDSWDWEEIKRLAKEIPDYVSLSVFFYRENPKPLILAIKNLGGIVPAGYQELDLPNYFGVIGCCDITVGAQKEVAVKVIKEIKEEQVFDNIFKIFKFIEGKSYDELKKVGLVVPYYSVDGKTGAKFLMLEYLKIEDRRILGPKIGRSDSPVSSPGSAKANKGGIDLQGMKVTNLQSNNSVISQYPNVPISQYPNISISGTNTAPADMVGLTEFTGLTFTIISMEDVKPETLLAGR